MNPDKALEVRANPGDAGWHSDEADAAGGSAMERKMNLCTGTSQKSIISRPWARQRIYMGQNTNRRVGRHEGQGTDR